MDLEQGLDRRHGIVDQFHDLDLRVRDLEVVILDPRQIEDIVHQGIEMPARRVDPVEVGGLLLPLRTFRSEEHTSELQSLMRTSYAVFCLKKKTTPHSSSQPPCI